MASALLDSVRKVIRSRYYSIHTEKSYLYWITYYIRYHGIRHPEQMGPGEVVAFLEFLALERKVSPSTQKTALNALMFLYRAVLGRDQFELEGFVKAAPKKKIPVVLERHEIKALLAALPDKYRLCAQ